VISDFTGIDSMMHMSSSGTVVPGATGLQGTRYEVPVIFGPSWTWLRTTILLSHLPLTEPGQPARTRRKG
jgi:hypothetical protein